MLSADNLRRFRTYVRRVVHMPFGGLRHPCFFMHVPKCGGTSISEALYATVPLNRRVGLIDAVSTRRASALLHADRNEKFLYHDDFANGRRVYDLRESMLLVHMAWGTELIHGHVLFSDRAYRHFGERYHYVTLLREPIERTVSNYLGSVRVGLIPDDFDAYLQSEVFRTQGISMLRYFSGRHPIERADEARALELAKAHLERFSIIGFLDELDVFRDRFHALFGRRPVIYRYNSAHTTAPSLGPARIAHIRAVLATEIELWEHARRTVARG